MSGFSVDLPVGVVGAGTMGAGIAQVAAAAGHRVNLFDAAPDAAQRAVQRIDTVLERVVSKGRMTAQQREDLVSRIEPVPRLADLAAAGLVVEAVIEDLDNKRRVLAELEARVAQAAILATNTSSISITALGAQLTHPGRLVGMHFFNPVPLMSLVEVISGLATDPEAAKAVHDTAIAWGKSPVYARSTPGFIANRVARPFYAEALRVLQEGAADAATLDSVMREAGCFRMGPFELMDLIGLDVNLSVTRSVYDAFYQDSRYRPSLVQEEMVAAGFLGRKSGRGFYTYAGEPGDDRAAATVSLQRRPARVCARGALGPLEALVGLLEKAAIVVTREPDDPRGGHLEIDGEVAVALTDGRSATERMAAESSLPLVLVDLALDYASASRVALASADQAPAQALDTAAGLFQALGKTVSPLGDIPGLLVMRSVCMLVNEGADAVNQGVCAPAGVDTAMCKGLNFPRGPFEWAVDLGLDRVLAVLRNLRNSYGEDRYRVSPWLRRKAFSGDVII